MLSLVLSFARGHDLGSIALASVRNLDLQIWQTLAGRTRLPPRLMPLVCDQLSVQQALQTFGPLPSVHFPR
eukprot:gene1520-11805_t